MSYVYQRDRINQTSNMKGSKLAAFSASKANSRLAGNINQKNQVQRYEQTYHPQKNQPFITSTYKTQPFKASPYVPFYKKCWFWTIIALLILAGIGSGVFFILKFHNNQVNATSDSQTNNSLKSVGQSSNSSPNATQTNNSQNSNMSSSNPVANQTGSNTGNTLPITQPTPSTTESKNQTTVQNKTNNELPAQITPATQKAQNPTNINTTSIQAKLSTLPQPFTITDEQKIVSPTTTQPTNSSTTQPSNSTTQQASGTTMPDPQDYYTRHPQQRPNHHRQSQIGQVHNAFSNKSHKRLRKYE